LGLFLGISFGFLTLLNAVSVAVVAAADAMYALGYVFKIISPHFLLVASFGQLTNSVGAPKKNIVTENTNIFLLEFWGGSFLIFVGQFLIYGFLTLLLENMHQLRLKRKRPANHHGEHSIDGEDNDVAQERALVNAANLSDTESNLVWVKGLRKEFNSKTKIKKTAVHDFSLRIPRGECFGLLGANGAGKTTTLKMLSGQLLPTLGDISINGNSYENLDQILQSIGFCPQYDSVIPKLSGRAHLELFAEIRGLPKHKIPSIVDALIEIIHLTKYADRPCGKYSGGNRRKLSLALALIGNPPVLYLDEPSTGMDPLARRFMWNLIMAVRSNKAIILTTHSMEESEALCTRLGIMIGGKLHCLGSPQHLKTKFGEGYRLELKTDLEHVDQIPQFIQKISPEAKIIDQHTTLFNYEIPMLNLTLGQLLEQVEGVKQQLHISDYSVSQTTLEQIFINMAREHLHPKVVVE
jgi:ABC-type multidrug transport system ATPase subunit